MSTITNKITEDPPPGSEFNFDDFQFETLFYFCGCKGTVNKKYIDDNLNCPVHQISIFGSFKSANEGERFG